MKEYLRKIPIEPFEVGDLFIGIIFRFIALVIIGLFLSISVTFYDKTSDIKNGVGVVVSHKYEPSYTSYIYNGKTSMPQYHSEKFKLMIEVKGLVNDFEVSELSYNIIKDGDKINCEYRIGRLTKSLYIYGLK